MKLIKTLTWGAAFTAGVFFCGLAYSSSASAQSSSTSPRAQSPTQSQGQNRGQSQAQNEQTITGELTRVMPDTKMFTVKNASGSEMMFKYNDQTAVTGAETNVAGLATSSGSQVTVMYRNESAGNVATKIEVHQKK